MVLWVFFVTGVWPPPLLQAIVQTMARQVFPNEQGKGSKWATQFESELCTLRGPAAWSRFATLNWNWVWLAGKHLAHISSRGDSLGPIRLQILLGSLLVIHHYSCQQQACQPPSTTEINELNFMTHTFDGMRLSKPAQGLWGWTIIVPSSLSRWG